MPSQHTVVEFVCIFRCAQSLSPCQDALPQIPGSQGRIHLLSIEHQKITQRNFAKGNPIPFFIIIHSIQQLFQPCLFSEIVPYHLLYCRIFTICGIRFPGAEQTTEFSFQFRSHLLLVEICIQTALLLRCDIRNPGSIIITLRSIQDFSQSFLVNVRHIVSKLIGNLVVHLIHCHQTAHESLVRYPILLTMIILKNHTDFFHLFRIVPFDSRHQSSFVIQGQNITDFFRRQRILCGNLISIVHQHIRVHKRHQFRHIGIGKFSVRLVVGMCPYKLIMGDTIFILLDLIIHNLLWHRITAQTWQFSMLHQIQMPGVFSKAQRIFKKFSAVNILNLRHRVILVFVCDAVRAGIFIDLLRIFKDRKSRNPIGITPTHAQNLPHIHGTFLRAADDPSAAFFVRRRDLHLRETSLNGFPAMPSGHSAYPCSQIMNRRSLQASCHITVLNHCLRIGLSCDSSNGIRSGYCHIAGRTAADHRLFQNSCESADLVCLCVQRRIHDMNILYRRIFLYHTCENPLEIPADSGIFYNQIFNPPSAYGLKQRNRKIEDPMAVPSQLSCEVSQHCRLLFGNIGGIQILRHFIHTAQILLHLVKESGCAALGGIIFPVFCTRDLKEKFSSAAAAFILILYQFILIQND